MIDKIKMIDLLKEHLSEHLTIEVSVDEERNYWSNPSLVTTVKLRFDGEVISESSSSVSIRE